MTKPEQKTNVSSSAKANPEPRGQAPYIGGDHEIEPHFRNKFILGGYRVNFNSPYLRFKSLFMIHNQTVNIWTHLLCLLAVLLGLIYVLLHVSPDNAVQSLLLWLRVKTLVGLDSASDLTSLFLQYGKQQLLILKNLADSEAMDFLDFNKKSDHHVSRWPIMLQIVCSCLCLGSSAFYHLFMSMSDNAQHFFKRLDYAGINFLISGTTIPLVYYGYYCDVQLQTNFTVVSITLAIILFSFSLTNFFHSEKCRIIKVLCYGSYGIFSALPLFTLLFNQTEDSRFSAGTVLPIYLMMGFFYLSGLAIYATRCPQRYRPGRYDICGQSHQIWHCMVGAGVASSYFGSLIVYYMRQLYWQCPV